MDEKEKERYNVIELVVFPEPGFTIDEVESHIIGELQKRYNVDSFYKGGRERKKIYITKKKKN